ncbi:hypothetical protein P5673_025803 [Acropora cervicornis]|uniref:Uncharacterized protein n=1 Tax=Acropora cervicornis TaxID=6130 RepID=A0AAD9UX26_ACRCE|nr:hypothetical protein P5673_025803 [Acropora cervicornis]
MAVVLHVSLLFMFLLHPCISANCGPLNKDIKVLKEQDYWYFEHPKPIGSCKHFKPEGSKADSFTLVFLPGEVVAPATEPPITKLQFQCDRSATWNSSSDGEVPFQPKVSLSPDGDNCRVSRILHDCHNQFFPGMFLYCVVGALIRKGQGKTGKDVIPHAQFLSDLPGLIADGFSFTLAKITCSQMSTTQQKYDEM